MARPRSRLEFRWSSIRSVNYGRAKCSLGGIELVDQDLIESEVRYVNQLVVFRRADPVRVRTILALGVRADSAGVFLQSSVVAKFSVSQNRIYHHVAAIVIRGEKKFSGAIERKMAGIQS